MSGIAQGKPEFIPSKQWTETKPGYVFRTSSKFGTGYHLDAPVNGGGAAFNGKKRRLHHQPNNEDKEEIRNQSEIFGTTGVAPLSKQRTGDELLAEAELQASELSSRRLIELSHQGVRLAVENLERTLQRNQLLRAQHEDDPSKFMLNELALNDEIVSFKSLAVNVSLYETFIKSGAVLSFSNLLNHENSDIAISTINVLVELLDPKLAQGEKGAEENEEAERDPLELARNVGLLANELVSGGCLDLISSNLGRFDDCVQVEAKGIEDALTLVESLLELDKKGFLLTGRATEGIDLGQDHDANEENFSIVGRIWIQTRFVSWLFKQIERSNIGESKTSSAGAPTSLGLYSSELLASIIQHEDSSHPNYAQKLSSLPNYIPFIEDRDEKSAQSTQKLSGLKSCVKAEDKTIDGIEILLQSIANFRKRDPQTETECEFLENIYDSLAASLLREENVLDFVEHQGIELMLRCLREKVHAGGGALKVLNFALSGFSRVSFEQTGGHSGPAVGSDAYKHACEVFVNVGGLKVIFPIYMARKSAIPRPAKCSEGGSDLARKTMCNRGSNLRSIAENNGSNLSKRAKRASHARKKWLLDVERDAIQIVYALVMHLCDGSQFDSFSRLLVKFIEQDCEKCDRTIELYLKYDEKARIAEYQYYRSDEAEEAEQAGVDTELAALDAKLRGGADMSYRTCVILSFACVGSKRCYRHVIEQLKLKGSGFGVVKSGLAEFASLLIAGFQKERIENYISQL